MADIAHKQTDDVIEKVERKVKREYRQAQKDVERKAQAYFDRFAAKDAKKKALVDAKQLSEDAYNKWRAQQLLVGDRWNAMADQLAQDYVNASHISNSIIKGHMPEVYALNHNYSTYEIETGLKVDTTYTLYNAQTVERLIRDNPQILPDPTEKVAQAIRDKKIKRWSKQKMTSALTQAILQGESVNALAKRLRSVTDMNAASALRNARTMITNAENAGRYDAYRRARDLGVKFKVIWLATLDNRTRHEHRMLDGQMQEVDEPFVVDGIQILYPADYGGKDYKVPPDMIYNCRCTIGAAVKGSKLWDEGQSALNRVTADGSDYEDWKNAKNKPKPEQDDKQATADKPTQGNKPQPNTFKDKVDNLRTRIKDRGGDITEDDLREAGEALADDFERYIAPKRKAYEDATAALDKYKDEHGITQYSKQIAEMQEQMFKTKDFKEFRRLLDEQAELQRKQKALQTDEYKKLLFEKNRKKMDYEGNFEDNSKWLKDKLGEVRLMGSQGLDVKGHLNNGRSPMRKVVEQAYDCYPSDWVRDSVNAGTLSVKKTSRGYYSNYRREIAISGDGKSHSFATAVHEVGHRMEDKHKGILDAESKFYSRRTKGEELKWLGSGYAKYEVTRKDKFIDAYMGKDYGGRAYELVSMGFQYAYTEPLTLAKDKDMQTWIYGLLTLG